MNLVEFAAAWRPNPKWSETVRPAYEAIVNGATGLAASHAWSEIAMMMGDTRAAPLALVVCLHAERLDPMLEDRRLASHRNLCLMDLGLAHAEGPVRLVALGDPDAVAIDPSSLEAWLQRSLVPFDGDLERAALFALRVAARRTELIEIDPTP